MTVKEVLIYGVIACAIWSITQRVALFVLLRFVRFIAPRLGKRAHAWAQRFDEYCGLLMSQPMMITVHHIKVLQLYGVMNWGTIVAMTGLTIYAISGAWTALSAALFIVGLIYYVANYFAYCYQRLILSATAARIKAVTGQVTPAQDVELLLAREMTHRLALIALLTKKDSPDKNSDANEPPQEHQSGI